jgi:outer membrane lipoprotein LolB
VRFFYLFPFLGLFVGCSPAFVQQQKYESAEQVDSWELRGRLAISGQQGGKTMTFYWSRNQDDNVMRFALPLGLGSYVLHDSKDQGAMLITANKKRVYADDMNGLLDRLLGWVVPVNSFGYWVRGLPDPDVFVAAREFDEQGRLSVIRQGDWDIRFARYAVVNDIYLPGLVFVQSERFMLRLAINRWTI